MYIHIHTHIGLRVSANSPQKRVRRAELPFFDEGATLSQRRIEQSSTVEGWWEGGGGCIGSWSLSLSLTLSFSLYTHISTYIYIYIYGCVYVCMYVCMYLCMYLSSFVSIHLSIYLSI